MSYLKYILAAGLAYLLQTTLLASGLFRPELALIVFCLFLAGRSAAAVACGFLTGAALDVLNGCGFYNTVLYTGLGLLCGFMPVSIFRDFRSLALTCLLLGSVWLNLGYPLLSRALQGKFIYTPFINYLGAVLANIIVFYLLQHLLGSRHPDHG